MKLIAKLVAATGLISALPAMADPVTLDFEDQASFLSLNIPASYGFTANSALMALANDPGEAPFFSGNPSGDLVMFGFGVLEGERAELATLGQLTFAGPLSFSYSSMTGGSVYLRDFAGDVIETLTLAANSLSTDSPFSIWTLLTVDITAPNVHSIDFTDALGSSMFDDVTVSAVPLPAAVFLLPAGLAAFGLVRRRKQAGAVLPA
jgi:hypothetical protein